MTHNTLTLNIGGMHCTSCSMHIDFELEDIEGVVESSTSYAKSISVVKFDSTKVKPDHIISKIKGLGYEVDTIT